MKQSIFLTTVNETRHRLDMKYFCYHHADGHWSFTTGISVPEAGIKLALSKHHIDRILVIGPPSCARPEETGHAQPLDSLQSLFTETEKMSEYGFLCWRIQEYVQQRDTGFPDPAEKPGVMEPPNLGGSPDTMEPPNLGGSPDTMEPPNLGGSPDIMEHPSPGGSPEAAAREKLRDAAEAFRLRYAAGAGMEDLFRELSLRPELAAAYEAEVCAGLSAEERGWLKHELYSRMGGTDKMRMLEENRGVSVCFIPIETDGVISLESMTGIIREILSGEEDETELFVDAQGMSVTDGSILISTLLMLNRRTGCRCSLRGLIESEHAPERFCGRVRDVHQSYNITMLISGLEQFLDYGRTLQLKEYWKTLGISDPGAARLFDGMDLVDEGISLCQVDLIEAGIGAIRSLLRERAGQAGRPGPGEQSIYLEMVLRVIRADYGPMLEEDGISIPELLKWSLRKGFYQQMLTIIESRIPGDMAARGIYYYAETEEDLQHFLETLNKQYWTGETWKTRYVFADPEHYFVRHYLKDVLSFGQTREEAAENYAASRVRQLHESGQRQSLPQDPAQKDSSRLQSPPQDPGESGRQQSSPQDPGQSGRQGDPAGSSCPRMLPAYSQLADEALLEKVLNDYYLTCSMRNQINHAQRPSEAGRRDLRESLCSLLEEFTEAYSLACERVQKTKEPLRTGSEAFAEYIKKHKIHSYEREYSLSPEL